MNRLRLFVMIVLAACWLPATSHCALEAASLVAAHCSDSAHTGAATDDCDAGVCCAWESALAQPVSALLLKAPDAACVCALCAAVFVEPTLAVRDEPVADHPRPAWISTWQFERRTALPVRAPALT